MAITTTTITFSGSLANVIAKDTANLRPITTSPDGTIMTINAGGTSGNRFFISSNYGVTPKYNGFWEHNLPNNFTGTQDCRLCSDLKGIVYLFTIVSGSIRIYNSSDAFTTYATYTYSTSTIINFDVDIDSNNIIHLACSVLDSGYTKHNIIYVYFDPYEPMIITYHATAITTGDVYEQNYPSIAVDSTNDVWIAWLGERSSYVAMNARVANLNSSWTITNIDSETSSTYDGNHIMIASDTGRTGQETSYGYTRIVWYKKASGYNDKYNIYECTYDSTEPAWSGIHAVTTDNTYDQINPFIGVQVDPTGNDYFYLVWEGKTSAYPSNYNLRTTNGAYYANLFNPATIAEITTAEKDYSIFAVPRKWKCSSNNSIACFYDDETSFFFLEPTNMLVYNTSVNYSLYTGTICDPFDTQNPVINNALAITSNDPEGGDSTVSVLFSITDTNPNSWLYEISLDNSNWDATTDTTNVELLSSTKILLITSSGVTYTLNGDDHLYLKGTHTDKYGNQTQSTLDVYVKPRQPAAPILEAGSSADTEIDVTIVDNSIDAAAISPTEFEHKLYISPNDGTNIWVQADGSLGSTAVWNTVSNWGTVTVSGLTANTVYSFYSITRNPNNTSTESDNGITSTLSTTSLVPVIDNVIINKGSWEEIEISGITQIDDIIEYNGYYYITSYDTTDGGIWRSSNFNSWSKIKTGKHRELAIFDDYLYVHYNDGTTSYLIRSNDLSTWVTIATISSPYEEISALCGSDINNYIFYGIKDNEFTSDLKVYGSTDGTTFSEINFNSLCVDGNAYISNIKELSDDKIYLLINNYLTSYGLTWTDLGTQISQTEIRSICYVDNGIIIVGTAPNGKILRSTNYGLTWTDLGTQASQTHIVSMCNVGSGIVIAGTYPNGKILRSTDYGATWTDLGTQASQNEISALCNVGGGIVVAGTGTNGKILRSTDSGATWTDLGAISAQSYVQSLCYCGNGIVLAGTGRVLGSIFKSTDSGATWGFVYTELEETIYSLAYLGTGIVVAGTAPNGLILRSTDSGANWTSLGTQASETSILSLKYLESGVVLAGTSSNGKILRSTDYGLNWTDLGTQTSETSIYSLEYLESGIALAGTGENGKLLISTYGLIYEWNDTTTKFEIKMPFANTSEKGIYDIILFSYNSKYYILSYLSAKIYESSDLITWTLRYTLSTETPVINTAYKIYEFKKALYVACYHSSNNISQIWKSTDGIAWVLLMDFSIYDIVKINGFFDINGELIIYSSTSNALYKYVTDNYKYTILYRLEDDDSTLNTIKSEFDDGSANYLEMSSLTGEIGDIVVSDSKLIKTMEWNAGNDYPDKEVTSYVKVTTTDPTGATNNATSLSFLLDTIKPIFGESDTLTISVITGTTVTLVWSNPVTETNFSRYEIIYSDKSISNSINKSGEIWNDINDSDLSTKTTVTTTITGLSENTLYHFALFAVDLAENYSVPLTISDTTLRNKLITGYTMDEYNSILENVLVLLYNKDDGELISSTTSNSSGYFSISFSTTATYLQLVGIRSGLQSIVLDNLIGTYANETSIENYNLNLKKQQFVYATGNIEIWIGDFDPTLFINKNIIKNSIKFEELKTSININKIYSNINKEFKRKLLSKSFTLNFQ